MTQEFKDRIFQGARRMVIWGESQADVLHRLEVNGIPEEEAQQMYKRALAERISLIRTNAVKQAVQGLGLLLISFLIFSRLEHASAGVSRSGIGVATTSGLLGLWRFFKGFFGCLFAHAKEGSLADDEDDNAE